MKNSSELAPTGEANTNASLIVSLDQDACANCRLCVEQFPQVFGVVGNDTPNVIIDGQLSDTRPVAKTSVPTELQKKIFEAVGNCAGGAIRVTQGI